MKSQESRLLAKQSNGTSMLQSAIVFFHSYINNNLCERRQKPLAESI